MQLTLFGKAVRKARIDSGCTLKTMAHELNISISYLSALETGKKKISPKWVKLIEQYFLSNKIYIHNLKSLADLSNNSVSLLGLPKEHKMLIVHIASLQLTSEQVQQITNSLPQTNYHL